MHERGNGGARFRPATSPLILGFGPSLRITDPRNGSVVRRRSFVAGVHDSYVVTESPPYQHGIEVRLTPLGGYSLLRVPMHTLANRAVALEDVLGPEASTLADHLVSLPDWEARFDRLDGVLLRALGEGRAPSPTGAWAWQRLEESSGRVPIGALAGELGCTRKHVAQRFRDEVGVSPKTLARVLRFNRAVHLLRDRGIGLADIALRCGYSDQAHFNRDFREFAGLAPGAFALRTPVTADM